MRPAGPGDRPEPGGGERASSGAATGDEDMARWKGWGAGPAGAGSTGGPSRAFLVAVLAGCLVAAGVMVRDGHLAGAAVVALGAVYFVLRVLGVLGGRR